jgi:hypothetical protein
MQIIALLLTVLLSAAVLAAPTPGLGDSPAALTDRSPQDCMCFSGVCQDTCGQYVCFC